MKNLKNYVEGINRNCWGKLFSDPVIDLNNLTEEVAQRIFSKIDSDLSPENLCCDGELPRAQVNKKYKMLTSAVKELVKLGYTPKNCYEIRT